MDPTVFATDWPARRGRLQHLATHVVAQARRRHDAMFDLVPAAGGFSTPMVGPERERVRVAGPALVIERVSGATLGESTATTTTTPIAGASLRELAAFVGFTPDPDFSTGPDTPPLGDIDAALVHDALAANALGAWYLLGQRAIDEAVSGREGHAASVGRLWPEHFDYGIDLDPGTGARCNLGAAAGDSAHETPYLYVGPWTEARPGDAAFWNAPFGAVIGVDEIAAATDPAAAAAAFFGRGLEYLADG